MATVEVFTKGKSAAFNDDVTAYNESTWVLCDGASDTYNREFDGRHSGEVAARLACDEALVCALNGKPLTDRITTAMEALYRRTYPEALTDPKARFATTMICARAQGSSLVVTQVGDSVFRLNGTDVYSNTKKVDALTSHLRAHYIKLTGDIPGSRDFIIPIIQNQYAYANNSDHVLGYGALNGTPVPERFVHRYTFALDTVKTLELCSDGYYDQFPKDVDIAAYESLRQTIEAEDPDKYKTYMSTKSNDDRTVMIVRF